MERNIYIYILVMSVVSYLIRMLPLVLIKKKITNRFVLSFLHYVPYAVLTIMTVPAIFYATGHWLPATIGFVAALIPAWFNKSLPVVAALACCGALLADVLMQYVF